MATIVVGVDGSEGSRAALRFAIEEAVLRSADVDAVASWQSPAYAFTGVAVVPPTVELAESAKAVLGDTIEAVTAELGDAAAAVTVNPLVVEGPPAAMLVEHSRDAQMLVVGSRGYGGFRGLLLGSVSHQCASHANCPVVVVPSGRET